MAKPKTIVQKHAADLVTIVKAAKAGHLTLVEGRIKATGEIVAMICAVGYMDGEYVITPFAHLHNGNPYDVYDPPAPNGGF